MTSAVSPSQEHIDLVANTPLTPNARDELKKAILATMDHRYGGEFSVAVDWKALGLTDYLQVIKRPMDLSLLLSNLESGVYKRLHEVITDCDLIWENCKLYNGINNPFYQYASECQAFFAKKLRSLSVLAVTQAEHEAILARRFTAAPSTETVPLTPLQMHLLVESLQRLTPERLAAVLYYYMIEKGLPVTPESLSASNDDIVIDIANDSHDILHKVYERTTVMLAEQERLLASGLGTPTVARKKKR